MHRRTGGFFGRVRLFVVTLHRGLRPSEDAARCKGSLTIKLRPHGSCRAVASLAVDEC